MLKRLFHVLTLMLAFCLVTVSFVSGVGGQLVQPETESGGVHIQTEVQQKLMHVSIQNNNLSVELVDAEFGTVLQSIAQKSGFRVVIGGDVFNKKLNTKFEDMELERGVMRLFNLIREKNYAMKYDAKGKLDVIEIFESTASASAPAMMQPQVRPQVQRPAFIPPMPQSDSAASLPVPAPGRRPVPIRPPSIRSRALPQVGHQPSTIQAPNNSMQEQTENEPQNDIEEEVKEIPYMPIQKRPVYIPPKTP